MSECQWVQNHFSISILYIYTENCSDLQFKGKCCNFLLIFTNRISWIAETWFLAESNSPCGRGGKMTPKSKLHPNWGFDFIVTKNGAVSRMLSSCRNQVHRLSSHALLLSSRWTIIRYHCAEQRRACFIAGTRELLSAGGGEAHHIRDQPRVRWYPKSIF